jgi:hypothetical protein
LINNHGVFSLEGRPCGAGEGIAAELGLSGGVKCGKVKKKAA